MHGPASVPIIAVGVCAALALLFLEDIGVQVRAVDAVLLTGVATLAAANMDWTQKKTPRR
jgi:hypothetical protein